MQSILSNENCEIQRDTMKDDDNSEKATTAAVTRRGCKILSHEEEVSDFNDENAGVKGSKEKTPMCLVNDLARFNKISFQYRLTGEKGPAHCKQFTVTLELGDEVYTSEGFKIKKAQHLAAKDAIQRTKYKHPVPKVNRRIDDQGGSSRPNVTPTVELNALAMKLGQQTYYIFDPRQMGGAESNVPAFEPLNQPRYRIRPPLGNNCQMKPMVLTEQRHVQSSNHNFSGTFVPNMATNPGVMRVHQESHYRAKYQHCYQIETTSQHFISAPPPACRITLIVGTHKFYGVGRTIQQAKHDAASQAIIKLKEEMASERSESVVEQPEESDHKSPISLVFEIGIKRNLPVDFKILREDGPAHMRKFITACIVGDIVTEGEGTGKKASKKKAAQKMIDQLGKLPPLSPVNVPVKRIKERKTPTRKTLTSPTKNKNVTQNYPEKSQKIEADIDNPVAKMIEWCKENDCPEPEFKTLVEKGKERSRRSQFVVEVTTNDYIAQGCGNSKKTAKRNAAQNFLLSVSSKMSTTSAEELRNKKVKLPEECQILDGQNVAPSNEKVQAEGRSKIMGKSRVKGTINTETVYSNAGENQIIESQQTIKDVSNTMVQLSVSAGASETKNVDCHENSNKSTTSVSMPVETDAKPNTMSSIKPKAKSFHMKDKLMYLAKIIGFEVDFSDYPKGNHNEFLTILMISTNPPQICHGVGVNSEESQEDASKNALKILSEMGLNSSMK